MARTNPIKSLEGCLDSRMRENKKQMPGQEGQKQDYKSGMEYGVLNSPGRSWKLI